jgi:hypothetical protein
MLRAPTVAYSRQRLAAFRAGSGGGQGPVVALEKLFFLMMFHYSLSKH